MPAPAPLSPQSVIDRRDFILAHARLTQPPHTPEISLYLADEITPIWRLTEEELGEMGLPPPFWAFAWAGGQALARYLLDHPGEVKGKRVLDVGTGSGLVAIAAMQAGAAAATGADLDAYCEAAVSLNTRANEVEAAFVHGDPLAQPARGYDVICAGDVFYEKPLAERALVWLKAARDAGARVLIGDPGRTYFPKSGLVKLAEYSVQTTRELEDALVKRTAVWTFPAA